MMTKKRWGLASIMGFVLTCSVFMAIQPTPAAEGSQCRHAVITVEPKGTLDGYNVYLVEGEEGAPAHVLTLSPVEVPCCYIIWIRTTPDAAAWSFYGTYGCRESGVSVRRSFPTFKRAKKIFYETEFSP